MKFERFMSKIYILLNIPKLYVFCLTKEDYLKKKNKILQIILFSKCQNITIINTMKA
jgi:hypothetical protein